MNNDLISRKQAIEAVQNRHMMLSKEKVLLINNLEKLPSAQLATDTNVGTKLVIEPYKIERAIRGLTEWQKHVQTESDIDRDISVAVEALKAQLGTDLAEVGTDCISRQDALEAFGLSEKTRKYGGDHSGYDTMMMYEIQDTIEDLPTIQPEIVRCKDCKYAEYIDDVQTLWCTECGQGRTVAPNDFCSYADRREVTT